MRRGARACRSRAIAGRGGGARVRVTAAAEVMRRDGRTGPRPPSRGRAVGTADQRHEDPLRARSRQREPSYEALPRRQGSRPACACAAEAGARRPARPRGSPRRSTRRHEVTSPGWRDRLHPSQTPRPGPARESRPTIAAGRRPYGSGMSGRPLGPTVPTLSPSSIVVPRRTRIEPRWTSVTAYPVEVRIVTVLPPLGTVPANVTVPPAAASTGVPVGAPMSMPRCWPAAYGSLPKEKDRRTGPSTGHVQPEAAWGTARTMSAASAAASRTRMTTSLLSGEKTSAAWYLGGWSLSNEATETSRRGDAG